MRILILSDIHSNLLYFDQTLKRAEEFCYDKIIVLGDVIGYFSYQKEIIDRLRKMDAVIIKGNHEAMLSDDCAICSERSDIYKIRDTMNKISEEHLTFLRGLQDRHVMENDGKRMLFIHGAPWDRLNGYLYEDSDEKLFQKIFELDFSAVFMGHTHRPYIRKQNGKIAVNCGSVGLPRDVGSYSSFCVYDTKTDKVDIYRIDMMSSGIYIDDDVHIKVMDCLKRKADRYFGKII